MTKNADKGKDDREKIYGQEVEAFTVAQASMLTAQALSLDKMKSKSLTDLLNEKNGIGQGEYFEFGQQKPSTNSNGVVSDYWDDVMDILSSTIEIPSLSFDSSSGGGSSGKGTSSKSWYEEEIDRLKDLVSRTKDTNTLLEKEEKNSYQKRIVNIQAAQAEIHKTANQFRAKGLSDTSDEIKQLKLMYHDLADEVVSIYQEMHDDLMENNNDREWELNLFRKNRERADRSVEEIVADNEKIVAEYKAMQQEVADLAAYYRSMGYDETDDLIQDLSDAWWDYQEQLESVYDSLTKAFEDYISESDRQIRTLERTTGTAGQQIEIYTQRINEAKKALQALQSTNINGINNERIGSMGGDVSWERFTYPLTWVQPDIESITLYGEQRCDYIMVSGGEVSGALLGDLLTNFEFEPSWTLDTWFLATFNGTGINGGNITPSGDSITGAAVYRLKKGDRRLQLVANVGIGSSTLVDEGFRNQSTYTYYVFVLGTNTYVSAPLISNPVTPMFWNWTVLDCSVDSNGTYHLEEAHLFRNSVSTDSISNNNAPSLLQNFTPYPLRQPSSYNFKSSTLTGYIGRVDMKLNQYIDTVDMAEALYNLSVSNNPKFLRDRKGNLWRIQTNAAVSMQTGDTMVPQPYFGSFPWAEVGAADGISIICQPGDGAWDSTTGQEPDSGETVTKIVVTAPFGSTVTLTNGQESYTEVCYGYITYQPATPGDWTVTAMRDGSSASETITMAEGVTYYVGLVITEVYATLIIAAPSGTVITVSQGSEFEETKVVP